MAATKVDLATQINNWVIEPAKRAYTKLEDQCQTLGRQFSVWSDDTFASPWNIVAKKIFSSLPIAAAIFAFPLSVNLAAGVAFYVADLGYGPFSQEIHDRAFAGIFLGATATAAFNTAALITTLKPGYLLGAVIYGVMSGIFFPHAKLTEG